MKHLRFFIYYFIAFFFITGCKQSQKVKIDGDIIGFSNQKIYLAEYLLTHERLIDSTQANKNDKFSLKLKIQQPQLYKLYFSNYQYIWLLPSPGEKIRIKIELKDKLLNYQIEGSPYSEQVKILNDTLRNTITKLKEIEKKYVLALMKKDPTVNNLESEYQKIIEQQRKFSISFVIQNLKSPASIIALYQQFTDSTFVFYKSTDLQYIKLVADTLSKYFPESRIVKQLCNERNRLLSKYNNFRKQSRLLITEKAVVSSFPDIRLPDINGDTISVAASVNKLLLLTFWSPTNNDSYAAMSTFSSLYNKYHHQGLEIYNIALFDDTGYWRNLIKKLKIPGIHVIDETGIQSARLYNVQRIPSTVLLSREGILAINLFGDRLEKEIRKNLSK